MTESMLKIIYAYNESALKTIEAEYEGDCSDSSDIRQFIIRKILEIEKPDLISPEPPIPPIPWGSAPSKSKTPEEIAKMHGISKIVYEINNARIHF